MNPNMPKPGQLIKTSEYLARVRAVEEYGICLDILATKVYYLGLTTLPYGHYSLLDYTSICPKREYEEGIKAIREFNYSTIYSNR